MLSSVLVLVGVHWYVLCNEWFGGTAHCFRLGKTALGIHKILKAYHRDHDGKKIDF
jgi:hypothetical protein